MSIILIAWPQTRRKSEATLFLAFHLPQAFSHTLYDSPPHASRSLSSRDVTSLHFPPIFRTFKLTRSPTLYAALPLKGLSPRKCPQVTRQPTLPPQTSLQYYMPHHGSTSALQRKTWQQIRSPLKLRVIILLIPSWMYFGDR